jgi:hypothetical protein
VQLQPSYLMRLLASPHLKYPKHYCMAWGGGGGGGRLGRGGGGGGGRGAKQVVVLPWLAPCLCSLLNSKLVVFTHCTINIVAIELHNYEESGKKQVKSRG